MRGYVLWNFRRCALTALRYALFSKVILPDFVDPADHVPEFIEKGHLVEVVFERSSLGGLNKPATLLPEIRPKLIASDGLCLGFDG